MRRTRLFGTVLLLGASAWPAPARSQAAGASAAEASASAAGAFKAPARPVPSARACSKDWLAKKEGDCWVGVPDFGGKDSLGYVHPHGWIVDPRCLDDKRFSAADFIEALDQVWAKMSPDVPVAAGGCLSDFNPSWGRELADLPWKKRVLIACPAFDKRSSTCAGTETSWDGENKLIRLANVQACAGPGSSGLAGTLFHESLHAADADNLTLEEHNTAWELDQLSFVRDRVYGTEALCFFGVDPAKRKLVNILQCDAAVAYHAERARRDLCKGFDTHFTNVLPAGFLKH